MPDRNWQPLRPIRSNELFLASNGLSQIPMLFALRRPSPPFLTARAFWAPPNPSFDVLATLINPIETGTAATCGRRFTLSYRPPAGALRR